MNGHYSVIFLVTFAINVGMITNFWQFAITHWIKYFAPNKYIFVLNSVYMVLYNYQEHYSYFKLGLIYLRAEALKGALMAGND